MTDEISRKWRQLLESEEDTAYTGQWLGFYVGGEEDPALVLRCGDDFTPECMQKITLTLPPPPPGAMLQGSDTLKVPKGVGTSPR